ncbi:MAG: feruloyl esterase [Fibrobacteraceae bacterium]|nr:feruloyl esterase [Fibrobacteraceae bacterium]
MHLRNITLGCGVLFSAMSAFAWQISGVVQNSSGMGIPDVAVSTMNIATEGTTTSAVGAFELGDGTTGIHVSALKMGVEFRDRVLTLNNVHANNLKVSVVDALGKVVFHKNLGQMLGSYTVDLNRFGAQKNMFLRVNMDGQTATYQLNEKGSLLKEGDILPLLNFTKTGYAPATYQMVQEVEANVVIKMQKATPAPASSNSVEPPTSSADEPAASSSSTAPVVTDCSGKSYAAGNHNMSVNVNGKNRTFIMHVPDAYKGDKPVPLVIDYHPIGGSGQGQLNGTTYKARTDPEGVISFYPDGTGGKSMMGAGWNVGPCCSNDDDVAFSYEMINYAKEKLCIDTKRIYGTGFSMGGGMSNHVACMMNDVFAAVAPAAMDLNITNSAQCKKTRPISIIMFRGTNDTVCRYEGGDSGFNDGLNFLGAEKNFKFWADFNECQGSPSKNSNGCEEYSNCKDGTKVILCTKQGGGHEQGDGSIGWPFLKQFSL